MMTTAVKVETTSAHGKWGGVFGPLGTFVEEMQTVCGYCQELAKEIEKKNDSGQYDALVADLESCPVDATDYSASYDGYHLKVTTV